MPFSLQSPQERRLAVFCRVFAVVYSLGAVSFAALPGTTYRLVTLGAESSFGPEAAFWNALAVSMMVALAAACAVVAQRPRERRHALLPVVGAKLTSSGVAAMHLVSAEGPGRLALLAIIATDIPLFVLTLLVYRSAAPGVHSEPAREDATAPAGEPPKVQLGVPK
jgi:hypothetical protein